MKSVIGGQSDETAPRCRKREEDLDGSILPDGSLGEFIQVWIQNVEINSFTGSVE